MSQVIYVVYRQEDGRECRDTTADSFWSTRERAHAAMLRATAEEHAATTPGGPNVSYYVAEHTIDVGEDGEEPGPAVLEFHIGAQPANPNDATGTPFATFDVTERCPTCARQYVVAQHTVVGATVGGVSVEVVTRHACACGTFDEAGVKVGG